MELYPGNAVFGRTKCILNFGEERVSLMSKTKEYEICTS